MDLLVVASVIEVVWDSLRVDSWCTGGRVEVGFIGWLDGVCRCESDLMGCIGFDGKSGVC